MTNEEFARNDKLFQAACKKANVRPTRRQASKWRRGCGLAFAKKDEVLKTVDPLQLR